MKVITETGILIAIKKKRPPLLAVRKEKLYIPALAVIPIPRV
jgi:hypothetical protein